MYKPHFLFFNDHPKDLWLNLLLRRLHSDTNLNDHPKDIWLNLLLRRLHSDTNLNEI